MEPFFSIVILARNSFHLLPLTLDTIKSQSEKNFEVVIVSSCKREIAHLYRNHLKDREFSQEGLPKLHSEGATIALGQRVSENANIERSPTPTKTDFSACFGLYPEVRVFYTKDQEISEMMNEGIRVAKGRYLQFLDPGDRFLSHQGLSYLRQLIQDSREPHLVYSSFLMRGPDEPPQAVSFSFNRETLQKGMFPSHFRASWFRRDSLQELGGFNEIFFYRPTFDFFCRLYRKKDLKVVYTRRVLTDSEPHSVSPKEMVGYAGETCRILYRHFGLWHALRWIFVQDHLKMLRWTIRLVKQAFWKSNGT